MPLPDRIAGRQKLGELLAVLTTQDAVDERPRRSARVEEQRAQPM
jgi:hypothetical protein